MMLKWKELAGGPGGARTLDLMTASHARSQLRHRPNHAHYKPTFLRAFSF